jgi:hypothetical protein
MSTWKNYKKKETPKPTNPLVGMDDFTLKVLGLTPDGQGAKEAAESAMEWLKSLTGGQNNEQK